MEVLFDRYFQFLGLCLLFKFKIGKNVYEIDDYNYYLENMVY